MNISNQQLALIAGSILVFPTLYFITASLLYYNWNYPNLYVVIEPIFNKPENQRFGWNINLLILFGPIIAFIWNFFYTVKISWAQTKEQVQLNFSIRKRWLNIMVAFLSFLSLAALFAYLIGENCR
ncbi:MAG: hypothetical protein ABJB11_02425 [Ferruginibacter sp.]